MGRHTSKGLTKRRGSICNHREPRYFYIRTFQCLQPRAFREMPGSYNISHRWDLFLEVALETFMTPSNWNAIRQNGCWCRVVAWTTFPVQMFPYKTAKKIKKYKSANWKKALLVFFSMAPWWESCLLSQSSVSQYLHHYPI